jgi:long-chain acyl-CoA synthetase
VHAEYQYTQLVSRKPSPVDRVTRDRGRGVSSSESPTPVTVATILEPWLRTRPGQIALVDAGHRMTYRELDECVEAVASGLVGRGVVKGGRVGVCLPNSATAVIVFLAIARLGAVFVGIHPRLGTAERSRIEGDADLSLLIASAGLATGRTATLEVDPHSGGVELVDPNTPAIGTVVGADDALALAYTSGTTGRPKGIVHDHGNALLPAEVILRDRMAGREERVGVQLPLTTLNVMIMGPLLAFLGGGSVVCIDSHEPARLAEWIRSEGIDHLSCSPATAHDLVHDDAVAPGDLKGLRLGVGGAACPETLRQSYRTKFGSDFTTGYGLSEAPAAVTQETEAVGHRRGASGKAMAHVEVLILDEDLAPVPANTRGQIALTAAADGPWRGRWTGPKEYWRRPDLTAAARSSPYLLTGDDGHLDVDGYLYVAGRRDDVINRGGSKVAPSEVEEVLRSHPAVHDCLVLGLADDRLGEMVAAVVEATGPEPPTETELRRHCTTRLAGHKVPSVLVVARRLERNPMGKIDRDAAALLLAGGSDPHRSGRGDMDTRSSR